MTKSTTKLLGFFVAAIGLMIFSSQASAQGLYTYSCSNPTYGTSGTYNSSYIYSTACGGTLSEAGTVATSSVIVQAAVARTANLIGNRIAAVTSGTAGTQLAATGTGFSASSGINAGNGDMVGVWASASFTSVEEDSASTRFDGDHYTLLAGADYQIDDQILIGLSLGYEDHDYDTQYNNGSVEGDGFTIAPYAAYTIDQTFSVSLTAGYSDLEYDTTRADPGGANVTATGNTDADRYFVEGRINAYWPVDLWRIRGSLGLLHGNEEKDAYTETLSDGSTNAVASQETEFSQFNLNTEWGYELSPGFVPYLKAGIQYDLDKDDIVVGAGQTASAFNDEDFGGVFGVGARFNVDNAITAGIEASTVEFRDDYEEYTIQGNLRVAF